MRHSAFYPRVILTLLLATVAGLYYPGTGGPFMLDDFTNLVGNPGLEMTALTPTAIGEAAFAMKSGPLYRPVSMASFALTHYFAGALSPSAVKLGNILIHALTTALVFFLTRRLLVRLGNTGTATGLTSPWPALLVAALWGLHPLHVSTVLYAVQRMTELAAMFCFAGALLYLQGRERLLAGDVQGGFLRMGLGLIGCGALATLSKETGALLPVLVLVIEITCYRFTWPPAVAVRLRWLLNFALVIPTAAVVGYLLYRFATAPEVDAMRGFNTTERFLTQGRVLWFYFSELVYPDPARMSLFHSSIQASRGLADPPVTLAALAGVAVLAGGALWALLAKRAATVSFAVLWFLGGHLLESTVIPLELVFEHRNYLPSYGPVLAIGVLLANGPARIGIRPAMGRGLVAVVLVVIAAALALRVYLWSDLEKFLTHELANNPNSPRVWSSSAHAAAGTRLYEEAVVFYGKAADVEPHEVGHLVGAFNLSLFHLGRVPEPALLDRLDAQLGRAALTPYASDQLAILARKVVEEKTPWINGRDRAIATLRRALENPAWPSARVRARLWARLGAAEAARGRPDDAISALRRALSLNPTLDSVRLELIRTLVNLGYVEEARRELAAVDLASVPQAYRAAVTELRTRAEQ